MDETDFDDARLDDPAALDAADAVLRSLALTGARIRLDAGEPLVMADSLTPRGVVVVGAESRLLRAVMETACPVPLVAWSFAGLPGWTGALDLVVVQAGGADGASLLSTVAEAVRRGASLLVAAPADSAVAAAAGSTSTVLVPTRSGDPLAGAVALLGALHPAGLGPEVVPESVARQADLVAEECSPHKDLSTNPAKDMAIGLADAQPLLWGGSVLAARAARRVGESLRHGTGRPALAASAEEVLPVMRLARVPSLFADPSDPETASLRPVLVTFHDGDDGPTRREYDLLCAEAARRNLRASAIRCLDPNAGPLDRYVSLLMQGRYAAAYLGIGLGRIEAAPDSAWSPVL